MVRKPVAKKRSRPPMLWMVVISGILCAILIFIGIQLRNVKLGPRTPENPLGISWQATPGQKVLLVMGVDAPSRELRRRDENAFDGTRTDTMMLVRVDSEKHKVAVVSIPRDSKVYISGNRGIDKINAAHAIGGPDLAVQTVQDAFGIPVDSFMVINFRGVRELVDAVGGIDVHVEKSMHYTDRTAKLFINFEPGNYHLNGEQAEAFLRFRHDQLGDIGRIRRQQQFVVAVTKKLRDPSIVFRIPNLVRMANKYVETDLSLDELITLAFFAKDINMNNIRTATLPGHPGGVRVSYWVVDPESSQVVLDRLILDNPELPIGSEAADASAPFKVGLLYDQTLGAQVPQIVTNLEQKGFKVVCKDQQRRSSTQIIEHTSRVQDERTDSLRTNVPGLANARLIFAPVGTTFENNTCSVGEDYTLILGADSKKP
jgi:LCP family protein required for cell wall assembly